MEQAAAEAGFAAAASRLKSALLETRYRPDQPRAPVGTPTGGQWILDLARPSARPPDEL